MRFLWCTNISDAPNQIKRNVSGVERHFWCFWIFSNCCTGFFTDKYWPKRTYNSLTTFFFGPPGHYQTSEIFKSKGRISPCLSLFVVSMKATKLKNLKKIVAFLCDCQKIIIAKKQNYVYKKFFLQKPKFVVGNVLLLLSKWKRFNELLKWKCIHFFFLL